MNDNALEGHPCPGNDRQNDEFVSLDKLRKPFHKEICLQNFNASKGDIQIKRVNDFFHIYCYGHKIILAGNERVYPPFVFEISQNEKYELNGHINLVSSKNQVLLNPHDLTINRDLSRFLKLNEIKLQFIHHHILEWYHCFN